VVWAEALSERAILAAIRAGHVFIDVEGTPGRLLELAAGAVRMGDTLAAPPGRVAFTAHAVGVKGARWRVVEDGSPVAATLADPIAADDQTAAFTLPTDGARHWIRLDVRTADDKRALLIGNPIYLEPVGAP
jgi:hypothetical protein